MYAPKPSGRQGSGGFCIFGVAPCLIRTPMTPDAAYADWHLEDRSIPLTQLPKWVWGLMLVLLAVPVGLFMLATGSLGLLDASGSALLWILVLMLAHEAVHAIAWKYAAGLPWSVFRFGVVWKALSLYCHATVPMPLQAYRIGAAMPLLLSGIVPWIAAVILGDAGLGFAAAVLISAAAGDVFILWMLRDLPAGVLVQDHDTQAGCIVLWPPDASPAGD